MHEPQRGTSIGTRESTQCQKVCYAIHGGIISLLGIPRSTQAKDRRVHILL